MANPQVEKGYIRIANDLWNEIIRRNFTKRQQNIIFFIWRLSYGTGQKDCLIPTLKMFELAGIHTQDVRKELERLVDCCVLQWNKNSMVFSINKDYRDWQITPCSKWQTKTFKQLIHTNIKRKTTTAKMEKVRKLRKPTNIKVRNLRIKRTKLVSKTRTVNFVKHEANNHKTPISTKLEPSVKTFLKTEKKKDKKELNYDNRDQGFSELIDFYRNNLQKGMTESPFNIELLKQWYKEFGYDVLYSAMQVAAKREAKGVRFIESILSNWKNAGVCTLADVRHFEEQYTFQQRNREQKSAPIPDWYEKHKQKQHLSTKQKTETEKKKIAEEADELLRNYLQSPGV
ncbi:replication protein [Gracilibacillus massiliensis]|uniref:replication protein n=1 Tax=Gracilibacillus massiliensis TaxID=1564956 RepID=UPI00071D8129|nr:replication protein [Gracilibacillus massiliensis]